MTSNPLLPWSISADEFPADGSASDQLEFLLGYAILAPSPHNTQPWLFRVNAKDVELFADSDRALPVADPNGRELVISGGAALFNLRVAAEHFGRTYHLELEPAPENADLLARFQLDLHAETPSEHLLLFDAIPRRRTCRHAFETTPIPEELLEAWSDAAARHGAWLRLVTEASARLDLAELIAAGARRQWADKRFRAELARWSRLKPHECEDGYPITALGVNSMLSFAGPSLVRTFNLGKSQANTDREIALHSPVLAILGTDGDDVRSWLDAGQAMENIFLIAAAEGLQTSYLNQPFEVPDLREQLAEMIGNPGYPQVLIRLGVGPEVPPTPRRPVKKLLVARLSVHH
jgi:nitroreductase